MEEGQVIATEYLYCEHLAAHRIVHQLTIYASTALENLPGVVQHLLTEIKLIDEKAQEIQADVHHRTQRYIRQSIKQVSSPKDLPAGIDDQYAQLDALAADKINIAHRLLDVLHRTCGRLDIDLARILAASGDIPDLAALAGAPSLPSQQSWAHARTVADKLRESLKADPDLLLANTPPPLPALPPPTLPVQKKRRLNPTNEPSPIPSGTHTPTRASRAAALPTRGRRSMSIMEQEPDAEGDDDDGKDGADQDDQSLYCYCRKRSYGEMVACDNPECPYQWFHINCLHLKGSLPESWYCEDCAPKFHGGGPVEKGRKGRKLRNQ